MTASKTEDQFPINKDNPPFFAWTTNPLHQNHKGKVSIEFFPGGPHEVREKSPRENKFLSQELQDN